MPCALHAALPQAKHLNPRGQGEEEAGRWRAPPRRLEVCGFTSAGFLQPGPGWPEPETAAPPGTGYVAGPVFLGRVRGPVGGLAGSGCPDAP